jgi:DHA2 family multidrug resistance protein
MLDLGKEHDWFESAEICALAIIAVVGLAAFVIWESTERHPIVDLRVFRHRGFSTCVLTISIGFGGIFAANVLTPLWLQSYMGYTSTWAGLATAWTGLLAIFMAPVAGMLMTKLDPRKLVCCGLVWIAAVSIWRVGATTDMTFWQISVPLMLLGLGLPFFFLPITAHALASVDESETASAAGLMNFLRTLSGAFATSLATTAWESDTAAAHAELAGQIDRSGETTRSLLGSGMDMDSVRSVLDGMTQGQSVMLATNEIMATCALAFCVAALLIWLAPRTARVIDMRKVGH